MTTPSPSPTPGGPGRCRPACPRPRPVRRRSGRGAVIEIGGEGRRDASCGMAGCSAFRGPASPASTLAFTIGETARGGLVRRQRRWPRRQGVDGGLPCPSPGTPLPVLVLGQEKLPLSSRAPRPSEAPEFCTRKAASSAARRHPRPPADQPSGPCRSTVATDPSKLKAPRVPPCLSNVCGWDPWVYGLRYVHPWPVLTTATAHRAP